VIIHEAALAWLFVPEVHLGSNFDPSGANAGQKSLAAMAQLQIWHPELRPEHLREAQKARAADGRPWWKHLSALAGSQLDAATGKFRRPQSITVLAHLRSYPRELLLAAHPVTSAASPSPRSTSAATRGGVGLADLHCHLNGAVPEHALWVAGVAGLLSICKLPADDVVDPTRVLNPQVLVVEAGFLRWWLAERLLPAFPEGLWSQNIANSQEFDGMPLEADGTGGVGNHLILANQTLRRYALAHRFSELDGSGAFRDPLQWALDLEEVVQRQMALPVAELHLQIQLLKLLSRKHNRYSADQETLRKNAARYLHKRCQFRAYCLLRSNEHGLLAFMRRYGDRLRLFPGLSGRRTMADEAPTLHRDCQGGFEPRTESGRHRLSRRRSSIDFKVSWCAEQALLASMAGGACATEFRVDLGGSTQDVKKLLVSYLHGLIKADVDGMHRVSFLHQLHRTQHMRKQRDKVDGLVAFLRGAAPDVRSLVTGMDLAGRELDGPPMGAQSAFQSTKCLKSDGRFAWSVHAGEEFLHPLSGLRWIDWCLDELPMRQGDRLSHLLALVHNPAHCLISTVSRALDLAWAWRTLTQLGRETADIETAFSEIPPGGLPEHSHFSQWVGFLSMGEEQPDLRRSPGQLMQIRPSLWESKLCRMLARHVVNKVAGLKVIVDVCPSSNVQVLGESILNLPAQSSSGTHEFPGGLREPMLRLPISRWPAKLPWVFGTDDPGLVGNTIEEELLLLQYADPRQRSHDAWKHRMARNAAPIVGRMMSTGYWRKRLAGLGGLGALEGLETLEESPGSG